MSSDGLPYSLARPSQTADPWGRYYTSPLVSRSLVGRIETAKPKLVLELGSGSGSLCIAAANRWQDANLVTVDVDCAPRRLYTGKADPRPKHTHFVHDVLDVALSDRIGLRLGSVDVALCNPPYIRPRWKSDFGKILEDAGLSGWRDNCPMRMPSSSVLCCDEGQVLREVRCMRSRTRSSKRLRASAWRAAR